MARFPFKQITGSSEAKSESIRDLLSTLHENLSTPQTIMLHMNFCNCRRSLHNAANASITPRSTIDFHIYSTPLYCAQFTRNLRARIMRVNLPYCTQFTRKLRARIMRVSLPYCVQFTRELRAHHACKSTILRADYARVTLN